MWYIPLIFNLRVWKQKLRPISASNYLEYLHLNTKMQHFPSHCVVAEIYILLWYSAAQVLWEKRPLCAPAAELIGATVARLLAFVCDSINHENALVCPQVGHLPGCPGGRRTRCSTTPPSPSTSVASRMYCVWENWNADIYIPSTHARRLITIFQPPSPARYPSTSTVSTISFSFLCGGSLLWACTLEFTHSRAPSGLGILDDKKLVSAVQWFWKSGKVWKRIHQNID